MMWEQKSRYHIESDAGYKVAKVYTGQQVRYTAWTPAIPYAQYAARRKGQYALGESVPQQSELIGIFDDVDEAKGACQCHVDRAA